MKKKFITTIILIILLEAVIIGIWFYVFFAIKKQKGEIIEVRKNILSNEEKIEEVKFLKEMIEDFEKEKEKIDAVFLDNESLIRFIEKMEAIATLTGVEIKFGSINMGKGNGGFPNLKFTLLGDFSRIFRFLALAENMPYLIGIENLHLQKTGDEKKVNQWQAVFDISLNTFYQK